MIIFVLTSLYVRCTCVCTHTQSAKIGKKVESFDGSIDNFFATPQFGSKYPRKSLRFHPLFLSIVVTIFAPIFLIFPPLFLSFFDVWIWQFSSIVLRCFLAIFRSIFPMFSRKISKKIVVFPKAVHFVDNSQKSQDCKISNA